MICDDPHNVQEAESDAVRKATLDWWEIVVSTRVNDPKTTAKVIVMQRCLQQDLSGHLLEQGVHHPVDCGNAYTHTPRHTGQRPTDARQEGEGPRQRGNSRWSRNAISWDQDLAIDARQTITGPGSPAAALVYSYAYLNHHVGAISESIKLIPDTILEQDECVLIDFGLSQITSEIEQRGVDVHVLFQTLDSTAPDCSPALKEAFCKGYRETFAGASEVITRERDIEQRGRYL